MLSVTTEQRVSRGLIRPRDAQWLGLAALAVVLASSMGRTASAQYGSYQGQPAPAQTRVELSRRPVSVEPVADSKSDTARQLHRLVESMPSSEEELEIIERRSQLLVARANIVRAAIADPSIIDVVQYSPREISIIALARGSTTLTLWFEGSSDPLIYLVRTIRDPNRDAQRKLDYGRLEKKLQTLFPNSKVYLIPMSYKIVVRGQARDQEEAAHILNIVRGEVINQEGSLLGPQPQNFDAGDAANQTFDAGAFGGNGNFGRGLNAWDLAAGYIINELRVPGEFQVSLTVRIAELSRSEMNRMGRSFSVLVNDGGANVSSNMLGGGQTGGNQGTLSGIFSNGDIAVVLEWMKTNGIGKILVEPRLTVLSGRQARFLAGGEFAVPTIVGIGGASGQQTTFRGYGTSVLVTPTILDRNLIRISTVAEYSNLDQSTQVNGIPGTSARRIDTTVEMREGQTLALAGLYSHLMRSEITKIPMFGDIPKIGPMFFTRKQKTLDENELLILITPDIVRPMDPEEVPPVPGFETTYPQDHEFWWYNRIEGSPDTGHYQIPPYGSGSVPSDVGYQHFNPPPASGGPVPNNGGPTPITAPMDGANGGYPAPTGPAGPAVPSHAYPPTTSSGRPSGQPQASRNAMSNNSGWSRPAEQGYSNNSQIAPAGYQPANDASSNTGNNSRQGRQSSQNRTTGQPNRPTGTNGRTGYSVPR